MQDLIITVVILAVVALAVRYIYKAKKSGKKCVGCPDGGSCSAGSCGCGCGCCSDENEE